MDINYSNIDGEFCINDVHNIDYFGIGNINIDPQFTDPDNGDFTLQPSSPCIDAGI